MVFAERALLEQHLPAGRVKDEHRDSAVKRAIEVRALFFAHTNLAIVFVDKNNISHEGLM